MSEIKILNGDGTEKYFVTAGAGSTGDGYMKVGYNLGMAVARGLVPNHTTVNKFGANFDVDAVAGEDIWSYGGNYVPPTTARVHTITSTSGSDTSAGTGARTLRVFGLDANFEEQTEDITLSGAFVNTLGSYTRINRMIVLTAGSNEYNVGDIRATAQTDATVSCEIPAGYGQSLLGIYSVPAGANFYMQTARFGINRPSGVTNGTARVGIIARPNIDTANAPLNVKFIRTLNMEGTSNFEIEPFDIALKFEGPCDIILRAFAVSDNNTEVTGAFDGIQITE